MTKADIVSRIADRTGMEKADVLAVVEGFMREVKGGMESGDNVYLRGFGSFVLEARSKDGSQHFQEHHPGDSCTLHSFIQAGQDFRRFCEEARSGEVIHAPSFSR